MPNKKSTVVTGTTTDDELLAALREEREKKPELAQTIDLHLEVISARSEIEVKAPEVYPDENEVEQLIDQRVPFLRRWPLEWDQDSFARLAVSVCAVGADHRGELASQFEEIRDLLNDDPDQTQRIVSDYLRESKVELPGKSDEDEELLSFVLIHALHPFMQAHAAILTPLIQDEKWYQRVCPVCGGEPDFGYLEKKVGGLRLLCSRCDTVWMYKRGECTFCGNSDQETFAYFLSDDDVYRLYVCDKCKRYLKVLDGRETTQKPMLPLQRITTIGMDISARQEGYR